MPSIYNLPKEWFKEDKMELEKLARWVDKQGWFKLDNKYYLLPDGSLIGIYQSDTHIIIEKDGKIIKTTVQEE